MNTGYGSQSTAANSEDALKDDEGEAKFQEDLFKLFDEVKRKEK